MRQLFPAPGEVDPVETYLAAPRPSPTDRPWVAVGMICSLDGATALGGKSGALGGPADRAVFRAVRAIADVILVGAGTVRAENYRPVRLDDEVLAARAEAGRSPDQPRLAVVTGTLDVDLTGPLFADDAVPPLLLTPTDVDPDRLAASRRVTEVRQFGEGSVDLRAALRSMAEEADVVVCEGGPSLNGALVTDGLVDEWCLTVSPLVAGGDSRRIASGASAVEAGLELVSLLSEEGMLFGRWTKTGPSD